MSAFNEAPPRPQTGDGGIDTTEYDRFRSGIEIRSNKQALQPVCVIHSGDSPDATDHDYVDTAVGHAQATYFTPVSDTGTPSPAGRLNFAVTDVTGSFVSESTAPGYRSVLDVSCEETSKFGEADIPEITFTSFKDGGVSTRSSSVRVEKYSLQQVTVRFDDTQTRRAVSRIEVSLPGTSYNTDETGARSRRRGTSGFVTDTAYGTDSVAFCGLKK